MAFGNGDGDRDEVGGELHGNGDAHGLRRTREGSCARAADRGDRRSPTAVGERDRRRSERVERSEVAGGRRFAQGENPIGQGDARIWLRGRSVDPEPEIEKNGVRAYGFNRAVIDDADGRHVVPHVAIIVEKLDAPTDAVTYSSMQRIQNPFHTDRLFIWQDEPRFQLKNAVVFEGNISYPDSDTGAKLLHRLVIAYIVEGALGVQVIADSTDSVYATAKPEFFDLLWSLSITGGSSG
jgi:hypothetical protein